MRRPRQIIVFSFMYRDKTGVRAIIARMDMVGEDIRNSKDDSEYSGNAFIISGMPLETAMVEQMMKDNDKMPMISSSLFFIFAIFLSLYT